MSSTRTRVGYTWTAVCVAVLILVGLVVFIAQNASQVDVSFLGFHGRFSLAVALLASAAAGSLLTTAFGTARILQLRRTVRHHEQIARAEASIVWPTASDTVEIPAVRGR